MRQVCCVIALSGLLGGACKEKEMDPVPARGEATTAAKAAAATPAAKPASEWPAPARKDGKAFAPLEPVDKLAVGATIELWWRTTRSPNPFGDHGPYASGGSMEAAKAPWGDEGGLSGATIMAAVRKAADTAPIKEVRLRGISSGVAGPDFKRGMTTVDDSASSLFNKAVGRTADGAHQVFVDVDMKKQ